MKKHRPARRKEWKPIIEKLIQDNPLTLELLKRGG